MFFMINVPGNIRRNLIPLFSSHKFGRISIEAILSGKWGEAFTDSLENPQYALLRLGGAHFLGGVPKKSSFNEISDLITRGKSIFLPDYKWITEFKNVFGNELVSFKRTSISSKNLNLKRIQEFKNQIQPKLELQQINPELVKKIDNNLTKSLMKSYGTSDKFIANGIGFCILDHDKVVSAAFAFIKLNNDIEIQINTNSDYRRKGLATFVSSALIEYCLEHNLNPHWDSANEISFNLAIKLGYTNPIQYESYYLQTIKSD